MTLNEALGITDIVLGGLLFIAASFTLCNMLKRKSIRFLKFITWLIIATSVLDCFNGTLELYLALRKSKTHREFAWEDLDLKTIALVYGLLIGVGSMAVFSVVWFTSFKYWNTAK